VSAPRAIKSNGRIARTGVAATGNGRTPVSSVLISGARLCEPQHVVLQISLLRVTDPRSIFKLGHCPPVAHKMGANPFLKAPAEETRHFTGTLVVCRLLQSQRDAMFIEQCRSSPSGAKCSVADSVESPEPTFQEYSAPLPLKH